MSKPTIAAYILAGGKGTRLHPLTRELAKPALHFGGSYRMIDFTLSNCVNSGINRIGVLTQYMSHTLHHHIGDGLPWIKSPKDGEVALLPSDLAPTGGKGYRGTADAVYQNLHFIRKESADLVLILSGDHIYHMDYGPMVKEHLATGALATVAVKPVDWTEASRFGIISTDRRGRLTEFTEKPDVPASNLASMGIYLFQADYLLDILARDAEDQTSDHDFGKNILPAMLREGAHVHTYSFDGYWKDVGTVESLWRTHMDLVDTAEIPLNDPKWPVHSRTPERLPLRISNHASVDRSFLGEGCAIYGSVQTSVVSCGAFIGTGSHLKRSVIMPNARIGARVQIENAIIGECAIIQDDTIIRGTPDGGITVIGNFQQVANRPGRMPKVYVPAVSRYA